MLATPMIRVSQKDYYVQDFVSYSMPHQPDDLCLGQIQVFYYDGDSVMCKLWPCAEFNHQGFVDQSSFIAIDSRHIVEHLKLETLRDGDQHGGNLFYT
jgi:hypothetical protein